MLGVVSLTDERDIFRLRLSPVERVAAACVFRKTSAEGTLKVEILKGQTVVSSMETVAPYGIITLGKMPDKDSIINQILGKILG